VAQGIGNQGILAGSRIRGVVTTVEGKPVVSTETSSPDPDENGLGPAIERYVQSAVYNGDWSHPPANPAADVAADNPLPHWTLVNVSGSAITARVVPDGPAASGYALRLTMAAGAAGDEIYLEQIVKVMGARGRSFTYLPTGGFLTGAATSNAQMYCLGQYLKADGVTPTGAPSTGIQTTAAIGASTQVDLQAAPAGNGAVPSDAYYLRIRVGLKRNTAAIGDTDQVTVTEVRTSWGGTQLLATEGGQPGTYGYAVMYQNIGFVRIQANVGGLAGSSPVFGIDGSGVNPRIIFPGSLTDPGGVAGAVNYRTDRRAVMAGDGSIDRAVSSVGWAYYVYHAGATPTFTPTVARALPISGGSVQIPVYVPSHMLLFAVTVRNTDVATARTAEWGLYELRDSTSVNGTRLASGAWAFTPGAASNQDANATAGPIYIGPGWYVLVIRNTSGAQTFGIGEQAGGTMGGTTAKTKTLGVAFGATLDLDTTWVSLSTMLGVILRGQHPGSTGYY
jgi:hypothetical protein